MISHWQHFFIEMIFSVTLKFSLRLFGLLFNHENLFSYIYSIKIQLFQRFVFNYILLEIDIMKSLARLLYIKSLLSETTPCIYTFHLYTEGLSM